MEDNFLFSLSLTTSASTEDPPPDETDYVQMVSHFVEGILMPIVCAFGVAGNLLNLAVLTRKQLVVTMENLEKSAHNGLVALAISDLFFCLLVLPNAFKERGKFTYHADDFMLYYNTYVFLPVVSLLIVCSCWLTVVMALARYFAICRPIHARAFISLRGTRVTLASVFVAAVVFNLPLFFVYETLELPINGTDLESSSPLYVQTTTELFKQHEHGFYVAYNVLHGVLGVVIPICVLAFCNFCLIGAVRRSSRLQRQHTATRKASDNAQRITITLVVIIILFVLLALPAEALKLYEQLFPPKNHGKFAESLLTNTILNFMQSCNFAVNFVLYCTLNAQFRKTARFLLLYLCTRKTSRTHLQATSAVTSTHNGHHIQMTSMTGDPSETTHIL